MRIFGKSVLLISMSVVLIVGAGCARKASRTTKVTVAGEATTRVEPDTAVLTVSVVTQNAQAVNAQQENARKSEAVAAAVRTTAGSSVEIKTSDLKNVGAVIDAASSAGANSIDGIAFVLRQTSPARGQALAEATQQAMNKANSIAQALGGHVSRVVEESEAATVGGDGFNTYPTESIDSLNVSRKAVLTPVASGQLSIKSNVQLIV